MKVFFAFIGAFLCTYLYGQEFKEPITIGKFTDSVYKKLDQVNALMYLPEGYITLDAPQLPDSLSFANKTKEEINSIIKKRNLINPYWVFGLEPLLKKGNIYIKVGYSWILMSSYFQFNNDDLSEEEQRNKVNHGLVAYPAELGTESFPIVANPGKNNNQLINADTVLIYEPKYFYKLNDTIVNYAVMQVNLIKFDLAKIRIYYYYPINEKQQVFNEIQKTWGIVRFKKDNEFTHPYRVGLDSVPLKQDLYWGKFSYINDPQLLASEREILKNKKIRKKSNQISFEADKLAMEGNIEAAIVQNKKALELDKENVSANSNLIFIALTKNDKNAAWDYWSEMNLNLPNNYQTKFNKGLIFERFKELDSAAITFNSLANSTDSTNTAPRFEEAKIYAQQNNLKKAQWTFERVLNIFSQEQLKSKRGETHKLYTLDQVFSVRLAYAQFLLKNNLSNQAISLMEETLGDNIKVIDSQQKKVRFAIRKVLSKTSLAELYFHLSHNYVSLNDIPSAKFYLEKAKENGKIIPEELEHFLR